MIHFVQSLTDTVNSHLQLYLSYILPVADRYVTVLYLLLGYQLSKHVDHASLAVYCSHL